MEWGKTSDEDFKKAMPMTIRLQSHDIIRTWAFYTITKGLYNNGVIPWKNIMVSGFVLDSKGKKMSKSKGNTVDPVQLIDKFGADAVRYGASSVKLGDDIPFQEKYLETGKKTIMKIFNASKFVHMHLEDYDKSSFDYSKLGTIDKWIISELQKVIAEATDYMDNYDFSKARATVEKFFWQVLCENYLEIIKDVVYKPDVYGDDARLAGQMTLHYVLERVLRLFAPFLPYVTEEVYSWKFLAESDSDLDSIHNAPWPRIDENFIDEESEKAGALAVKVISAVRGIKSREHVSQKHEVLSLGIPCLEEEKVLLEKVLDDIKRTVSVKEIEFLIGEESESMTDDVELKYELAPVEEKAD